MRFYETEFQKTNKIDKHWPSENTVEIEQKVLRYLTEKICNDSKCHYPQLTLRILMYMIAGMDSEGKILISARQLSKTIGVNYDTVTKCLKYLRGIEAIRLA